ncbi:MAG: iron ABC transporter permease [Ktedonobacterales bacterium]|nr:iron ABC transporter permease [Ktedonobacterales bacterium]
MALVLFATLVAAAGVGAVPIAPLTTARVILNQLPFLHFAPRWSSIDQAIVLLRLPRVCGAALVGAALGLAGTLFQGLLRNPLADPLLLGTSSGAALGATVAFLLPAFSLYWVGFSLLAVMAFAGALLSVALVYALATRRGRTPVVTLLLAGVAVGAIFAAAQTLLITQNQRLGLRAVGLYVWLAGGIAVQDWAPVLLVGGLVIVGLAASLLLAPVLDAFALGEEMVGHLGWRVERAKLAIVAVASLLVAGAVSISGLVGFVGLVAPHLCRILLGPRHRLLLPASALGGAIFVVAADLLARTLVAPSELPLGVLTALVGGPFFLWLLRRSGSRYSW